MAYQHSVKIRKLQTMNENEVLLRHGKIIYFNFYASFKCLTKKAPFSFQCSQKKSSIIKFHPHSSVHAYKRSSSPLKKGRNLYVTKKRKKMKNRTWKGRVLDKGYGKKERRREARVFRCHTKSIHSYNDHKMGPISNTTQ